MNFSPISTRKPKLCPIDPKNRVHVGEFLTMREFDIYISDTLWTKMDYPDHVQFAFDETEKVLGICKTDDKDPYQCNVKMQASGGAKVTGTSFIAKRIGECYPGEFDSKNENLTFLRGYKVDGYFCFDLKNAEKVKIKRVKKEKSV